jgi:serine/threonine-protein kinase
LFFMLTGRAPFLGEEMLELSTKALLDEAPRPSTFAPLSAEMEALIMECLAKDPAARPASMTVVGERLAAIQRRATPSATPRAAATPSWPHRRRTRPRRARARRVADPARRHLYGQPGSGRGQRAAAQHGTR